MMNLNQYSLDSSQEFKMIQLLLVLKAKDITMKFYMRKMKVLYFSPKMKKIKSKMIEGLKKEKY